MLYWVLPAAVIKRSEVNPVNPAEAAEAATTAASDETK
jgi:hypothetical protein